MQWGSGDMNSTYELTTSSRVVVPVVLNGAKERPMLMDSGSDAVLVTKGVVKELGLQPVSTASYIGIGYEGVQNSTWVLIKSMTIGGFSIKNVPAMVIEENDDFWKETGGLIPISLFSSHGVLYDRRGGKLTLYPSGTKPEAVLPAGSFSVKSLWFGGKPHVEVKVQDRAGLNFLVDTGAYTTFIAGQFAQEIGVHGQQSRQDQEKFGLLGECSLRPGQRRSAISRPRAIHDAPVPGHGDLPGIRGTNLRYPGAERPGRLSDLLRLPQQRGGVQGLRPVVVETACRG